MSNDRKVKNIDWYPESWKSFKASQQPIWPDSEHLERVINELKTLPALVFSAESRRLKKSIGSVNDGSHFILQAGNCAERFTDCNGLKIHNFLRIFQQMSLILRLKSSKEIISIGRIAGQYAKPRSNSYEIIDGVKFQSYRGDNVNKQEITQDSRRPNPDRLVDGYFRSAATLNLMRAFISGGYSDIKNLNDWGHHFFSEEVLSDKNYIALLNELNSLKNQQIKTDIALKNNGTDFYCSHEGLILDYETAFARLDTIAGGYYSTSAQFLWIGERTRKIDEAHVEFFRGIKNPIGVKIGPQTEAKDLIKLIEILNPNNEEGRLTLIVRIGSNEIEKIFPSLLQKVTNSGAEVVWMTDPMHGNTFSHGDFKVRSLENIKEEIRQFINICYSYNVNPGGVHLELTDEDVTECIGGVLGLSLNDLPKNYLSSVDPRLNAAQAVELALFIGGLLKNGI